MWTTKSKIIVASTVVFGIVLTAFAVLVYQSAGRAELVKLDARLESHCDKLGTELEEQFSEAHFPNWDDLRSIKTDGLPEVRFQIRDTAGSTILADPVLEQLTADKWERRFTGDTVTTTLRVGHKIYRCRRLPVEVEGSRKMLLEVAAPMREVHENLEHLRTLFLMTIPAALIITALAAYTITRTAFRPLAAMARAAENIEVSDLSKRLDLPRGRDEVHSLGATLNRMIARIEAAFRSQRQFVADASHEIRTPLTIINSELEYAQKAKSYPEATESIRVSLLEIDRLSRMVENLLLLTRLDSTQMSATKREFRLDELLVETVQLMRRLAESKRVTLDLFIQEAVEVAADLDMLKRAVLNVLENAVRYSPPDSVVEVALRCDGDRPDRVLIEIKDEGPGISEADQPHVFERFYRSPEARSGTSGSGLGLAIARMSVEVNDGSIRLSSMTGKGTTVVIELPRLPMNR